MINPSSTRLFHITAIKNLPSIVAAGHLLAKNIVTNQSLSYTNIAHNSIQERRAKITVPVGRGGVIHDYVPFYFAPRSPMLFAIHGGKVAGFKGGQTEVITLETSVERAIAHDPSGFAFYNMNASLDYSTAYDDLAKLDQIAWGLLKDKPVLDGFCKYYHSVQEHERYSQRMEKRQAEFLVHRNVPLSAITRIGVCNEAAQSHVQAILAESVLLPLLCVSPDWYY